MQSNTKEELLHELIRLIRTTIQPEAQGNLARVDDFTSMKVVFTSSGNNIFSSWILDMRATNHMCGSTYSLNDLTVLSHPTLIHLADGSTHSVTHTGIVTLHKNFTLTDVLLVPSFKYNLLSVPKLCSSLSIEVLFHRSHCMFQDRRLSRL